LAGRVIRSSGDQAVSGQRDLTARRQRRDVDTIHEAVENCNSRCALGILIAWWVS